MKNFLIEKYLGEGLTKPIIFKTILKVLNNEWMNIDDIDRKAKLPISKHGLSAHMSELVKKGKAIESMEKGKDVWKKA